MSGVAYHCGKGSTNAKSRSSLPSLPPFLPFFTDTNLPSPDQNYKARQEAQNRCSGSLMQRLLTSRRILTPLRASGRFFKYYTVISIITHCDLFSRHHQIHSLQRSEGMRTCGKADLYFSSKRKKQVPSGPKARIWGKAEGGSQATFLFLVGPKTHPTFMAKQIAICAVFSKFRIKPICYKDSTKAIQ